MAKNSKQFWMTIIIAAIVSILSSAITVSIISKNILLGPPEVIGPAQEINAHKCMADENCEVNALVGERALFRAGVIVHRDQEDGSFVETQMSPGGISFKSYDSEGHWRSSGHFNIGAMSLQDVDGSSAGVTVGAGIRASSYKGEGNAYACMNQEGWVYRSSTPCM